MTAERIEQFFSSRAFTFLAGWVNELAQPYCRFHRHEGFEVVYHERGGGLTCTADGGSVRFEEHDVVIYPPGLAHDQRQDIDSGIDICVGIGLSGPTPGWLERTIHIPSVGDPHLLARLRALTRGRTVHSKLERIELGYQAAGFLCGLLRLALERAHTSATGQEASRYAQRAREFIRQNYMSVQSVEEAARHVGISPDYLRHVFRRTYGVGIKQWLDEIRLARAGTLLRNSNLPLKSIARQCGYGNARYFCTRFKRLNGATPGAFRRGR
ncbi:MAG: helix-turn-helix transcriptional regulator [Kiritimatiellae bacterium]|nr:helix-turn-helix transcriptional regulator [Kiritimatiellia bacterium]